MKLRMLQERPRSRDQEVRVLGRMIDPAEDQAFGVGSLGQGLEMGEELEAELVGVAEDYGAGAGVAVGFELG
jgi:hypothetical protein